MSTRDRSISLVLVLLLGACFGLHLITDPDVFLHAAAGRALLGDFSTLGMASFHDAAPAKPYVADKWVSQIATAIVAAQGESALMLLQIALATFVAFAWWRMFVAHGAGAWVASGAVALALIAAAHRLEPRPETLSAALLAIVVAWLAQERPWRTLALMLGALAVVWVNCHGYFINGLLAIAAALAASVLGSPPAALGVDRKRATTRAALLFGAVLAASIVHPQGVRALAWPFRQLAEVRDNAVYREAIGELKPTTDLLASAATWQLALFPIALVAGSALSYAGARAPRWSRFALQALVALPWLATPPESASLWPHRVTWALAAAALADIPFALRDKRVFAVLLFAGFGTLALPAIRNVALIAPFALLVLAPAWSAALARVALERPSWRSLSVVAAITLAAVASTTRLLDHLAPGTYRGPAWTGWGVDDRVFAKRAADVLVHERLPSPILNDFHAGGYLLWRLPVGSKVFIAGNTSFYPIPLLEEFRREVMGGGVSLDAIVAKHGIRTVFLSHVAMETPDFIARLAASPRFALVHADEGAAIWVRRDDPEGARVIERMGEVGREGLRTRFLDPRAFDDGGRFDARPRTPGSRARLFPPLGAGVYLRAVGAPDIARALGEHLWTHASGETLAAFLAGAADDAGLLALEIPRLEEALARAPRSAALRSWLARALFVRAVTAMDAALAAGSPGDPRGALERARGDLSRSVALSDDQPGPRLALARCLAALGSRDEAGRVLDGLLRGGVSDDVRSFIANDPLLAPLTKDAARTR